MDKYKSWTSKKTQVLRDGSSEMIGGFSNKGTEISDSDISENESISNMWENYLTLSLTT